MRAVSARFPLVLVAASFLLAAYVPRCAAQVSKALLASGRIDEAISELNHNLSSSPDDAEASNLLCRAYYSLEYWDQAEPHCKKAVTLAPGNSDFHLWLGRVYGEKAERANFIVAASLAGKLRTEFERAVQLNPANVDARLDLSEFYIEAPSFMGGGDNKAREQAMALSPLSPGRDHWIYARIAEKKKDFQGAEREYRLYIDASKNDSKAWLNYTLFLRRRTRLDEMEKAVSKLDEAHVSRNDSLFEASNALYESGRNYALAKQLLRHYFSAGPVEAAPAFRAHYLLGELLEKQGDRAAALDEYKASSSLAQNFAPAKQALERVRR